MGQNSIVITGDSHGIGAAAAAYFLERGWTVFGCSATLGAPKVSAMKALYPSSYHHFQRDVADEKQMKAMFEAIARFGVSPLCVFVNAGTGRKAMKITESDTCAAERILSVNLLGAYITVKHSLKTFGTAQTFIVSGSVSCSEPGTGADWSYSASKAGVKMLLKEARLQYPNASFYHLEMSRVETRMTCMEEKCCRYARPEEIARIVFQLADHSFVPDSPDIKIIGGEIIHA